MARKIPSGDLASRFVSALLRFNRDAAFAFEDLHAFRAPCECYRDVTRSMERREVELRRRFRREARMSERAFTAAVRGRVSPKAAHALGI